MYILLFAILLGPTWAQQLSGSQVFIAYPGISAPCEQALNTTVSCPVFLNSAAQSHMILDADQVNALCVDSCHSSLEGARTTIAGACTADNDVIVVDDIAYPATLIVDSFLLTYEMSCRKDSKSGKFCDPQLLSWSNDSIPLTANQSCSDCWLGVQEIQLKNPLGYDAGLADTFSKLTSSCGSSGYTFTTPTAYALNSTTIVVSPTTTATVTPNPTCTGSYTVQEGDDCNSVAKAHHVSTFSLLYENGLDIYCEGFSKAVGTDLCIPAQCDTYTWQPLDSCDSVARSYDGLTVPQFRSWNPNFNSLCGNSVNFIGYEVCVSPPGGYLNTTTDSNPSITTGATAAVHAPTNAMDGSNRNCGQWYTVVEGDTRGVVTLAYSLSLNDFYFLNPEINANCTNLLVGVAYCVEPVGSISKYPGYTVTGGPQITVPPATFPTVNTAIPTSSSNPGFHFTSSLMPKASGTIEGCYTYRNYDENDALNCCTLIARGYDVTTDQLLDWNPSLSSNMSDCQFQSGYSYCVLKSKSGPTDSTSTTSLSQTPTATTSPTGPIQTGVVPGCRQFYTVKSGDSCPSIEKSFRITSYQFLKWNPSDITNIHIVGSDCTNLWIGYAYCVKGPASDTSTGANPGPTSPTQTGTASNCNKWHTVVSGDSCAEVEAQFNISFDQLYAWNPAIGSGCESLWVGYAVCVGVSS